MLTIAQESVETCTRLLVSQVRAIERAHKAGITPQYGQLEQLFDTADVLDRQLDGIDAGKPASQCGTADCRKAPLGGTSPYARLCVDCAGKAIAAAISDGTWVAPGLRQRS